MLLLMFLIPTGKKKMWELIDANASGKLKGLTLISFFDGKRTTLPAKMPAAEHQLNF